MSIADGSIDRQSAVPYYRQLADVLEGRITSGAIEHGARLPSENELSVEFRLSRATVRQAMQFLESRGAAKRIPNRGAFASEPPDGTGWMIQGKDGFLENAIGHQSRSVSTQVLRSGPVTLPPYACRSPDLPDGTAGFELVRVRSMDGTPALFSTNFSPPNVASVVAAATEVLSGRASLTTLLADAGFIMGGANRIVRAQLPTAEIADALGIERSAPMLCIRSTSWTADGLRYDVYETWVRSDVVPLEVDVGALALGARR